VIYACEHHDQVLSLWRRQGRDRVALAHVDFHDDMRGLLVDRRRDVAYPIGSLARDEAPLDAGNFLSHAVVERRVDRIRWVHDLPGGRAWDVGIVRYERDLFALPQRLRHRLTGGREYPLTFAEILLEDWRGPAPGERLSVDWDCFASILLDAAGISRRVDSFLRKLGGEVPPETYLVYSPEYSHPTLDGFRELALELTRRFEQPLEWLSPDLERGHLQPTGVEARLPTRPWMRLILQLRRIGIY
jgi:hypothetical protein